MADPVDLTNLRSMTDGDTALEKELFTEFFSSSDACLAALKANAVDGESEAWRTSAHALKGTAVNLGAERLGSLCKAAQEGKAAPATEKRRMLDDILQEYAKVKAFLETV